MFFWASKVCTGVPSLYFQIMEVAEVWGSLAKMDGEECKVTMFVPKAKYGKIQERRKVCE